MKDWVNNNSVLAISQTVTNYTDPHIYFAWAAVLEALHDPTDSGNFTLMLTDDTTHTVLYAVTSRNNSTADSAEAGTLAMVGTGAIAGQLAASSPDVRTVEQPVAPRGLSAEALPRKFPPYSVGQTVNVGSDHAGRSVGNLIGQRRLFFLLRRYHPPQ